MQNLTQIHSGAAAFWIYGGGAGRNSIFFCCVSNFQILLLLETNSSTEEYVDMVASAVLKTQIHSRAAAFLFHRGGA
jgi:hypothetical protein